VLYIEPHASDSTASIERSSCCAAYKVWRSEHDVLGSKRLLSFAGWPPLLLHPALHLSAIETRKPEMRDVRLVWYS
jgi:hypothetical protein